MNAENMINMVNRYIKQDGVNVTWNEIETVRNSRGIAISNKTSEIKSAKVLLLKEKFNLLQVIDTDVIGLSQNYTKYILMLPEVEMVKDTVITDNHNMKWKLGVVDWFDIGDIFIFKQAALTEVT
jgi:hypothetical protein